MQLPGCQGRPLRTRANAAVDLLLKQERGPTAFGNGKPIVRRNGVSNIGDQCPLRAENLYDQRRIHNVQLVTKAAGVLLRKAPAPAGFAVVDVETTGLYPTGPLRSRLRLF
jgi:hypothetical protein